jgi:hypothetical protein
VITTLASVRKIRRDAVRTPTRQEDLVHIRGRLLYLACPPAAVASQRHDAHPLAVGQRAHRGRTDEGPAKQDAVEAEGLHGPVFRYDRWARGGTAIIWASTVLLVVSEPWFLTRPTGSAELLSVELRAG